MTGEHHGRTPGKPLREAINRCRGTGKSSGIGPMGQAISLPLKQADWNPAPRPRPRL